MKKHRLLLLLIVMLFTLTACDSTQDSDDHDRRRNEEQSDHTSANKPISVSLPDSGHNSPSEKIVTEDLIAAFSTKNEHATISSVETTRTKAKDKTFEISLQLEAVSKYADWVYELTMQYTNYDQGWMLDNTNWVSESYERSRLPELQEMAEYVENYFRSRNSASQYLPVNLPTMAFDYYEELECEAIKFQWESSEPYLHAFRRHYNTAYWTYDPDIDNWKIAQIDDDRLEITPNYDLNFNGDWEFVFENYAIGNSTDGVYITNFTWDGFDGKIRNDYLDVATSSILTEYTSGHFKRVTDPSQFPECVTHWCNDSPCVFVSDNGQCIYFEFEEKRTTIYFNYTPDKLAKKVIITVTTPLQ